MNNLEYAKEHCEEGVISVDEFYQQYVLEEVEKLKTQLKEKDELLKEAYKELEKSSYDFAQVNMRTSLNRVLKVIEKIEDKQKETK